MADDDKKDTKQSNWFLAALHSFLDDREVEKQNKANEQFKDMFKNASEVSPHYMGHGGPGGRGGRGMVTQDATGGAPAPGLVQAMAPSPFTGGPGDAASVPTVLRPSQDQTTGLIGYDQEASVPSFKRPPAPYLDPRTPTHFAQMTPQGPQLREDMPVEPYPVTERVPLTQDEIDRAAALMRSQDPYAPVPPVASEVPLMPMSPYVPPGAGAMSFTRAPTKFSSGG